MSVEDPKEEVNFLEQGSLKKRINWNNKLEFILNVVGYQVGIGNVWRFSYLCFKNGGGAFMVAYLFAAATIASPLVFLEISLGQLTKSGVIGAWRLVPVLQGIGFSQLLMIAYCLIYYVVIMGWIMFYLVHSFTSGPLPWSTCGNSWNTENCIPISPHNATNTSLLNITNNNTITSTAEFWNNYALQKSDGLEDMGSFTNWRMLLCYLMAWLISYLCIFKGIKTSGKVVYVTALLPYALMLILLIRALMLEGALDGISFYITPNLKQLLNPTVWFDAVTQVIYSHGVGYTVLYGLGSYNKFEFDAYRSSYLFVMICAGSSILVGFVVFSFIGHLAFMLKKDVPDVAAGGPGLVFEVYPAGVTFLPMPQIWSVIFFAMLTLLAVDSTFGSVEGLTTTLADLWPKKFGHGGKKIYKAGLCVICMSLGLSLLFDGGIYLFELLNYYASSGMCVLWIAFFECFGITWVYGVDKYLDDVRTMIGYRPCNAFKYCFKYFTPLLVLVRFVRVTYGYGYGFDC